MVVMRGSYNCYGGGGRDGKLMGLGRGCGRMRRGGVARFRLDRGLEGFLMGRGGGGGGF